VRRLTALAAAVLVGIVALTGCAIVKPPGDAPLRYRDPVFSDVTVTHDIQYGSAVNSTGATQALKLDLYQPTGDTVTKRPAVVWVHGGGFSGGDKSSGPSPDLANKFAKLGYVTVSINYRLDAPGGCTSSTAGTQCVSAAFDAQHDAQAAVRWLRANADTYKIDTDRIGIGGESAGAITATLVGLRPNDAGSSGNPGFSQRVRVFASISGGLPASFADSGDANGIFFHGTADPTVSYQWSVDTVKAMRKVGLLPFLESYPGAGHVPYAQFGDQMYQHTDYYFWWAMDLAHAEGTPAQTTSAAERMEAKAPAALKR
jgi:acetyl esterase/lipase